MRSLAQAETDGQVEVIMPVQLVLVEGMAALQALGWRIIRERRGRKRRKRYSARASQVPSLFTVVEGRRF